jgi:hypothetical protein
MKTDQAFKEPVESTRVRLTLDLTSKMNAIVDAIAKENDTTKADVLRQAIEFLATANSAKHSGMQVGAWKEEGDRRVERIFPGM